MAALTGKGGLFRAKKQMTAMERRLADLERRSAPSSPAARGPRPNLGGRVRPRSALLFLLRGSAYPTVLARRLSPCLPPLLCMALLVGVTLPGRRRASAARARTRRHVPRPSPLAVPSADARVASRRRPDRHVPSRRHRFLRRLRPVGAAPTSPMTRASSRGQVRRRLGGQQQVVRHAAVPRPRPGPGAVRRGRRPLGQLLAARLAGPAALCGCC